jgi:adenosylmethionine-8-amino-7-oxononanoate aminotransferase
VTSATGAELVLADGRRILDAISSWWACLHGHAHPRIAAAIAAQARTLDHVLFAGATHEPAVALAEALVAAAPAGLTRVFFSDDGSTAVEAALKMAFQYWANRGERRSLFVTLEGAYHGDTIGAMSVGGIEAFRGPFRPLFFKSLRAANPYRRPDAGAGRRSSRRGERAPSLEALLAAHAGEVAALIIEPMVQGAGGMIVWPREFLVSARRACDRRGVLLIADEVFTGFGRTGKLFACEHGPIAPDILCLAKALTGGALPLAATLASREVFEAFLSEDRRKTFFHGHSFTANPIACAAALESIAMLEDGGLRRARAIEAVHRRRLRRAARLPAVADARGLGLIAALELAPAGGGGYLDALGPRLQCEFLDRDILLRPLGNVLYLLPPLCITDADLERLWDAVEEVVGGIQ